MDTHTYLCVTVWGAAEEEVIVLTARVILTASLSLAARVSRGTLLLAAIILRVPESSLTSPKWSSSSSEPHLGVTVVVSTDQPYVTVLVSVAVSLTLPAHPDIISDAAMVTTAASVKGYFVKVKIFKKLTSSPNCRQHSRLSWWRLRSLLDRDPPETWGWPANTSWIRCQSCRCCRGRSWSGIWRIGVHTWGDLMVEHCTESFNKQLTSCGHRSCLFFWKIYSRKAFMCNIIRFFLDLSICKGKCKTVQTLNPVGRSVSVLYVVFS